MIGSLRASIPASGCHHRAKQPVPSPDLHLSAEVCCWKNSSRALEPIGLRFDPAAREAAVCRNPEHVCACGRELHNAKPPRRLDFAVTLKRLGEDEKVKLLGGEEMRKTPNSHSLLNPRDRNQRSHFLGCCFFFPFLLVLIKLKQK